MTTYQHSPRPDSVTQCQLRRGVQRITPTYREAFLGV